jgi:MFS-type transporter involved in bile tolerance (Atg22 family)
MTVQFLVYVVTTLFTYIAGKVSKHFGWNYTLPVTIQNIIIIAIASVIGCLIHIENLDINGVITAVITAVGGVGTAVVAYDAKNK